MSYNPDLAPGDPSILYRFTTVTDRSSEPKELLVELREFNHSPNRLIVWGRYDDNEDSWIQNPAGAAEAVMRRLLIDAGLLERNKTHGL